MVPTGSLGRSLPLNLHPARCTDRLAEGRDGGILGGRHLLAALEAVCGTGLDFWMAALEHPVWAVAVAFLFSVWCTWLIARGTFR